MHVCPVLLWYDAPTMYIVNSEVMFFNKLTLSPLGHSHHGFTHSDDYNPTVITFQNGNPEAYPSQYLSNFTLYARRGFKMADVYEALDWS